jgi:hypothetical protein
VLLLHRLGAASPPCLHHLLSSLLSAESEKGARQLGWIPCLMRCQGCGLGPLREVEGVGMQGWHLGFTHWMTYPRSKWMPSTSASSLTRGGQVRVDHSLSEIGLPLLQAWNTRPVLIHPQLWPTCRCTSYDQVSGIPAGNKPARDEVDLWGKSLQHEASASPCSMLNI